MTAHNSVFSNQVRDQVRLTMTVTLVNVNILTWNPPWVQEFENIR